MELLSHLSFTDCNEELLHLALVQYSFDDEEHLVIPRPHGNSKKGDSFVRTMPSTLHKLRKVAVNLTPKFAVCEMSNDVMSATNAGSVIRNRQQVKDLRRRKDEGELVPCGKKKDPLFSIMLMCKESQGTKNDDAFVRIVSCAPEPMAVLASNWTLNDLDRFCTSPNCTVLCIDPTFSLGDFDVTVTTYRHLMLHNSSGKHPVMMGPLMIHKQKKFESYHFFASSLVGLKPSLCNLRAFGTDGEKAISNAMHVVFDEAVHLRCFLHFKGNLDSKLREYKVPKNERIEFLRDVFGNPEELEKGIVDADTEEEFEALIISLKEIWERRERQYNNPPQFHSWFVRYCKDEVKNTMLKPKRIHCGLGNPPEPFYTNDVESQNSVIKHQNQYKAKELPDFVATMQSMIINQKQEIERAVAGVGEYQITEEYKHFKVATRKFFQMTQKQKDKHIKAFFSSPLISSVPQDENSENPREIAASLPTNPLIQLEMPLYVADKIWKEAHELLKDNAGKICLSPGCTDNREWLVKSSDEKHRHPYFVECKTSGQILCEKSCTMYLSCKVCAHTIAVARHTESVKKHLKWLQKQKGIVSLSALADTNMPKGAGKKPNAHRKASLKSSTKRIKALLAEADSEELTPRIKISSKISTDKHKHAHTPELPGDRPGPSYSHPHSHSYPLPLCPEIKTSNKFFPFADTQERAHSPELQVPDDDPGLSFSPRHYHTYPPSLDPGIKTSFENFSSTDEREHAHTSELPYDIPGPSGLSYCHPHSHSYPPPLYPATFTSSALSTNGDQPFGQPPPLVSTGSLVQQVSMSYSPSANVLYAPVVSMQQSGSMPDKDIFWLHFVKGNISRCNGCGKRDLRGDDGRPKPPPYDLCIQHKEYVLFENPRTGMHQMSWDPRNVYYHAKRSCVTQKYGNFNPICALKIAQDVKSKLTKVHFAYLLSEFGLSFLNK